MRYSDFLEPLQARTALGSLDAVETRDLYFWDDVDGHREPRRLVNHILLYNPQTRQPVVTATKLYAVLPHREAFGRILDMVMGSGGAFPIPRVYVEDLDDQARLWLLFPSDPEEQTIGIRITNTYDRSVSLQGDLVIWMRPDDYAIVLSRTEDLGVSPLSLPHRKKAFEHLEKRTAAFIRDALGGESWMRIEVLIDDAQRDVFWFESDEEKQECLRGIFGKKLAAQAAGQVPDETNRWDLFCIAARTAHDENLTPLMRDVHRQKAEAFLRS
jgi:hypothetical protein